MLTLVIVLSVTVLILGYTTVNLLRRSERLEGMVDGQHAYIAELNRLIKLSQTKLDEIDKKGSFKSDDEIGWFFKNVLYIQSLLNNFIEVYEKNETKNETQGTEKSNKNQTNTQIYQTQDQNTGNNPFGPTINPFGTDPGYTPDNTDPNSGTNQKRYI